MSETAKVEELEQAFLIRNCPGYVRAGLIERALAEQTSLNAIAVEMLAQAFEIPYERRDFPKKPQATGDLYLEMPTEVHDALGHAAVTRRSSMRSVALDVFREAINPATK